MLSHAIKAFLDQITGLKFSPIVGMSESYPIASYSLSDVQGGIVRISTLQIRIQGEDFDEIEVLRKKIYNALQVYEKDPNLVLGKFSVRAKLSGGGILAPEGAGYFDSTQYFTLTYFERRT